MKKGVVLMMIVMLAATASFAKGNRRKADYKIISFKSQLLCFKVDRSFLGGTAELLDSDHNILDTEDLSHTHTMVDFGGAPRGKYVVKLKRGSRIVQFTYTIH